MWQRLYKYQYESHLKDINKEKRYKQKKSSITNVFLLFPKDFAIYGQASRTYTERYYRYNQKFIKLSAGNSISDYKN